MTNCLCVIALMFVSVAARAAQVLPTPSTSPTTPANVLVLSLKDATTRALSDSRKVKKAKEDFNAARESTAVVRSAFLPSVEFRSNVGTLHDRTPSIGELTPPEVARDRNEYDAQIVLTQPIFSGFNDLNNLRVKNTAAQEEEWRLKSTALDVSIHVIELYFGLQLAQAELEAELQVAKLREEQLTEVQNRFRHGRATELEALEAEYEVRAQDPSIKTLRRDIASKSLQLARIIGLPLDQSFTLSDALSDIGAVLGTAKLPGLTEAYEVASRESPKLKTAELTQQRTVLEQARDGSKHFPKLSFEAAAGYKSSLRAEFGTQDSMQYSGMLKLTVPLFSGLSSFDERRVNAAKVSSAAEELGLAREQLLQDLTDAFSDFELAESHIAAEKKNTELTARAVENAKNLFRAGRATQTSVLDSYSRELTARKKYVRALYDRIIALAKIRALTSP